MNRIVITLFALAVVGAMPVIASADSPTWTPTGSMAAPRRDQAAILLPDGKVLVLGGTRSTPELYDPSSGTFADLGKPNCAHVQGSVASPLADDRVLVLSAGANPLCAETYEPNTGTFAPTGTPNAEHNYGSATLLADGRVLVAAGTEYLPVQSQTIVEIYDPSTGSFSLTGSLSEHRQHHGATLLPDGKVLIVGGSQTTKQSFGPCLDSAELYDPSASTFTLEGKMTFARCSLVWNRPVLLNNGKVLIAGEAGQSAELFDPANGTFSATGNMTAPRSAYTATLLSNGKVLLAGGFVAGPVTLNSAELYDPATGTFSATASMTEARGEHSVTLLIERAGPRNGRYS